jgi:hypothetical protein
VWVFAAKEAWIAVGGGRAVVVSWGVPRGLEKPEPAEKVEARWGLLCVAFVDVGGW